MQLKTPVSFSLRVYYEDTDAGGVVYYANYLRFAERARTEALRSVGLEQTVLMREYNTAFVVRHCEVDFLKPAMLDDLLAINTTLTKISKVSLTMQQTITRGPETLVTLSVKIAVVNTKKTLAKLPEFVHKALLQLPLSKG